MVIGGVYRRKFTENDYRIDLDKDNYDTIKRKIWSVSDFGGAVVVWNNTRFRVLDVISVNRLPIKMHEDIQLLNYLFLPVAGDVDYLLVCSEYKWV